MMQLLQTFEEEAEAFSEQARNKEEEERVLIDR